MDMQVKTSVDALNEQSVTVKTQRLAEIDGELLPIGDVHAKAYVNSMKGRVEARAEIEEPYLSAVLSIWGDNPLVDEEY